jgi:monoamine oxidase
MRRVTGLIAAIALTAGSFLSVVTPVEAAPPRAVGAANCSDSGPYDVVIVGAGLSGLTASRELRRLGYKTLILEANDRIGGRGLTAPVAGVPIDYGGAWLHGVPTNPLVQLADAMGFTRKRTELEAPFYVDDRMASEAEQEMFGKAYEAYAESIAQGAAAIEYQAAIANRFCSVVHELSDSPDNDRASITQAYCSELDATMTDEELSSRLCASAGRVDNEAKAAAACAVESARIRVTSDDSTVYLPGESEFQSILPLLIENAGALESAAELNRTSAFDGSQFAAEDDDLIAEGFGTFVAKIGENQPVCLNSAVSDVRYGKSGVELIAGSDRRTYRARSVLVTVSVGVLQANRISFSPALPAWKQEAIDNLRMGNLQKVIIPLSRDIFGSKIADSSWVVYQGDVFPDGARGVMAFVLKPMGLNMAIGFFGGNRAKSFEGACRSVVAGSGPALPCDDPAVSTAVRALNKMFKAPDAIRKDQIHVTRWSIDETSLGAYSVPLPGYWEMRETLRKPVGDPGAGEDDEGPKQVFFSGEATTRAIYNGSFPGAYETGMQAAREIHAQFLEQRHSR